MAKKKLDENLVAETIRAVIEQLGVSATIEVSREDKIYFIDISSDDSSLLIGKHGSNLDSLQFILAVILKISTKSDDFEIFVDVNNWRRQKEERLTQMANSIAQKVTLDNKPQSLYNLSSSERRVIHSALSGHPEIETVSEGEGSDRHLIIRLRNA